MELDLTPDQTLFVDTARRFLADTSSTTVLRTHHETGQGHDPALWRRAAELGWASLLAPGELGGGSISGSGLRDLVLVAEAMGATVAALPLGAVNVVIDTLCRSDGPGHRSEVVPALMAGDSLATWACDEGRGTWRSDDIATTAHPDTVGWVLNGTKTHVVEAAIASWFLISARTAGGLSQFLVPSDAPGVTLTERTSLDLGRRLGDIALTDVRVGPDAVVGDVDRAEVDIERQLQVAVAIDNAETCGALDAVFAMTLEYAGDRMAFGRPLASYQALKHRFADMKMWIEACHATHEASAAAIADRSPDAAELVSIARSYIADKAPAIVQDCVQLHGGIGVTWEHDLHLFLRRVTQNTNLYGGVRHHRERIAELIG